MKQFAMKYVVPFAAALAVVLGASPAMAGFSSPPPAPRSSGRGGGTTPFSYSTCRLELRSLFSGYKSDEQGNGDMNKLDVAVTFVPFPIGKDLKLGFRAFGSFADLGGKITRDARSATPFDRDESRSVGGIGVALSARENSLTLSFSWGRGKNILGETHDSEKDSRRVEADQYVVLDVGGAVPLPSSLTSFGTYSVRYAIDLQVSNTDAWEDGALLYTENDARARARDNSALEIQVALYSAPFIGTWLMGGIRLSFRNEKLYDENTVSYEVLLLAAAGEHVTAEVAFGGHGIDNTGEQQLTSSLGLRF